MDQIRVTRIRSSGWEKAGNLDESGVRKAARPYLSLVKVRSGIGEEDGVLPAREPSVFYGKIWPTLGCAKLGKSWRDGCEDERRDSARVGKCVVGGL